ncbi:MAG: VCBS repeat-containing protein [Verrucomicrobia subdivision 3 bacterium]|nr:VCBS repeat-containing protein [Limisphaerales bacterium]
MDLNNDGHRDILSGSYSRMQGSMAGLFQVLWGEAGGKFKEATVLNGTDKEPLIIPIKSKSEQIENICTRPTTVDWNGDGKLDLVVGTFAGSFYVFTGEGNGKFTPKPEPLMTGKKRLKIKGHHGDPFIVDWDGDGDLDLLSGSSEGGVQWAENTGAPGKTPVLKEFETVIKPGRTFETGQLVSEQELTEPASSTRVWVDDVNGDGKLDILVGDDVTLVSMAKGLSEKEFGRKLEEWKKAYSAASKAMSEANAGRPEEAARKRFNEIYQKRTEFMDEDPTGYVWLYRRK